MEKGGILNGSLIFLKMSKWWPLATYVGELTEIAAIFLCKFVLMLNYC